MTHTSCSDVIDIIAWPGWTTWPTSTVRRLTRPSAGARTTVRSRFSRAWFSAARACSTWALAPDARASIIAICCGAVAAARSWACDCATVPSACSRRDSATCRLAVASRTAASADATAASAACLSAVAASSCWRGISSFAASGASRARSCAARTARAFASCSRASAEPTLARDASISRAAAISPASALPVATRATCSPLRALLDVTGTSLLAARNAASATARSASALATASW